MEDKMVTPTTAAPTRHEILSSSVNAAHFVIFSEKSRKNLLGNEILV